MSRLIAVEAVLDEWFVEALDTVWGQGDAVLPVDPRLPEPALRALLTLAGPAEAWWADGSIVARRPARPTADGDALVMATSGSTGEPKLAVLTHDGVRAAAESTTRRLGIDPAVHRWLACLPLAHVGGLGVVTRALLTGTPLALLARADTEVVRRVAAEGPTWVSLVPTLLNRLDASWFSGVLVGGAADLALRPANVVRTYGSTETGGGVIYDGTPLDGVEVRAPDGELELRGPTLLRAYRTPAGDVDPRVDGWFRTGDAGAVDADGRVAVHGRLDDVIITGAELVWPEPVEAALRSHPRVADVAVSGRADPEWGQRVVARVVPTTPDNPPTLAELRDHARRVLPAWALPREVVVVTRIERVASGKVSRRRSADPGPGHEG